MAALYVTSSEDSSGKTAICAGLGKNLLNKGKETGYFKPVITETNKKASDTDSDTEFIKGILSLGEKSNVISPKLVKGNKLAGSIKEAYNKISQDKDVIIVEGSSEYYGTANDIVKALNAKVLIVEDYSRDLLKTAGSYKAFGKSLLGIVINKVPKSRMEQARNEVSAKLDKTGVNILGLLPEERSLLAPTISELVEHIHGEILRGSEQSEELIENVMVGALAVDPGPDYFGRKTNKAAIIRSDRPDMQMAAMETSTRCLVLTGDTALKPVVLDRAENKNVPIIVTPDDSAAVIAHIEDALGKTKFNQENKVSTLIEILEEHLDIQAIYKGLGING